MSKSPYSGLSPDKWLGKTKELIKNHPLSTKDLQEVVLNAWQDIMGSGIGAKKFKIGTNLFPKPQIMAFFLHALIPLEFASKYPGKWRGEESASEKDLVFIPDSRFSIEIKASSHASQIFGNRSYAQKGESAKKSKSGYYLAINFEKFEGKKKKPGIRKIRFGWLDHEDWMGQTAATGQQARLSPEVEKGKLILLFQSE